MRKRSSLAFLSLLGIFAAFVPRASAFDPNFIISDEEILDENGMTLEEVEAFLSQGYLGEYETFDSQGTLRTAAEIIYKAAQDHGINPKFLLVLLQKEQSLVTDDDPTQKQLDWATGYAVCDDCSMEDPSLTRWKGFGKQVNSAALQFTEGYMTDIDLYGKTAGKYGPGITVTIDGTRVTPENAATAALYAYTPHLHGNENFAALWSSWFGKDYPNGTLMQASGEDGVWVMEGGYRRPITSAAALQSRFNSKLIVHVGKDVLSRFPIGKAISLPNYTLVKDESGAIYLLVNDSLRHIDSMEAFRAIGFSEDEIIEITNEEVANYDVGEDITLKTQDPQGRLLSLKGTGVIFYVENGTRHIVLDKSIMNARFPGATPTAVDAVVVEQYKESAPLLLPDGYLVKSPDNAAVYVIADGERRLIPSESVFMSFGYAWTNVKVIPEDVLTLHPLGEPLQNAEISND